MARILIIEDNPANMKLASLLLCNAGHTVLCAVDAETGLTLARADQPDLILMDIQLPGMDGLAATSILKQDSSTAAIPVIAVTAMAMKADQEKSQVAGCDAYIAKPLRYQELYAAIDTLLIKRKSETASEANSLHLPPVATILIVDDEMQDRKLLEMLLKHEGYLTRSAATGEEALASIAQHAPDLILLDIMMPGPGIDGYQVAQTIKAMPATSSIPIIMVTVQTDRSARMAGLNAGAEEFLTKPINRAELSLRVRNLLRVKAYSDFLQNHNRVLEQQVQARTADMRESEQNARHILDAAHDAFVAINSVGKITDWNAQAERLFGWPRQEAVGRNLADTIMPPQFREAYTRGLQHFLETGESPVLNKTFEIAAQHRDGREIPIELSVQAVKLRQSYTFNAFIHDITERKAAEKRLLDMAHFDPLTGLPNRRHYHESLERALVLARAQTLLVSVLFIDLDRFKNVNDTLGHALGDDLLRMVSARMRKCLQTSDILGRLGGDEFAIILMHSADLHAASVVANTIIKRLRRPFDLDGHDVTVTASIGITVFPADSLDAATLMKYADTAMYEAKSSGRDTYRFYTAEMNSRTQEKHDLENALRKAIDHDQFVLYYQPTMQIDTGQWKGAEALLRWNRPGHGLILPKEFIPTLEETGLIVPVGAWVIDTACKQIAEWERNGIGSVAVAVNVSGRQFLQADKTEEESPAIRDSDSSFTLLDLVRGAERAMSEHRIASNLLEFELTESTLMSEAEKTVGILQKLKSLGIRLSIDDFGTGYSSLAYLRRFPIDTLKIDRAFIRDVTSNADDASITMAIISMAHSLKLKVIAEGVETREQLDFLRTHGCDQAQGYLLARPMPAAELESLFRTSHTLSASQSRAP